jgi:hypothetical protein
MRNDVVGSAGGWATCDGQPVVRKCKVDDLAGHRLGEIIAFREGLHRVFFR